MLKIYKIYILAPRFDLKNICLDKQLRHFILRFEMAAVPGT
jgi:hypothetical protein